MLGLLIQQNSRHNNADDQYGGYDVELVDLTNLIEFSHRNPSFLILIRFFLYLTFLFLLLAFSYSLAALAFSFAALSFSFAALSFSFAALSFSFAGLFLFLSMLRLSKAVTNF